MSGLRIVSSFKLTLSTLPEDTAVSKFDDAISPFDNSYSTYQPSSSSDLMKTIDDRDEFRPIPSVFTLSSKLFQRAPEYDDASSDIETDCGEDDLEYQDYLSSDSETIFETEAPRPRLFFLRSLFWKLLHRCPECGGKILPDQPSQNHHQASSPSPLRGLRKLRSFSWFKTT